MITGSSAIQAQEKTNIPTTKIRVNLYQNHYMTGGSYYPVNLVTGGINWNGLYVNMNDATTFSGNSKGIGVIPINSAYPGNSSVFINYTDGQFFNYGNTIGFISTLQNSINSHYEIWNNLSSGGTVWGASTLINDSGTAGAIYNVTQGSSGRVYFSVGSTLSNILYTLNNTGLTTLWGATSIYTVGSTLQSIFSLRSYQMDNFDRLVFVYNPNATFGTNSLRILDTDGINVLRIFDVFTIAQKDGYITKMTFDKGLSLYFAKAEMRNLSYTILLNGQTVVSNVATGHMIFKSTDLLNWDFGLFVPQLTQNYLTNNNITPGGIIAGNSSNSPELTLFSNTTGNSFMSLIHELNIQSTGVDISSNMVNYYNQNNERINLTLGNLK